MREIIQIVSGPFFLAFLRGGWGVALDLFCNCCFILKGFCVSKFHGNLRKTCSGFRISKLSP